MNVRIVQYKYLGSWGPFKINSDCEDCDITTEVLKDMMNKEFRALDVVFEERPWLNNWIKLLFKGAWHAPIILVDGMKFYQWREEEPLFNREKLKYLVLKKLKDKREDKNG
jgi:hypothetical protein